MMSVVLPAPTGTITRSGFAGQVCAPACDIDNARPRAGNSLRQIRFMAFSFGHRARSADAKAPLWKARRSPVQYIIPLVFYADPA
jgi:hypothetical protein